MEKQKLTNLKKEEQKREVEDKCRVIREKTEQMDAILVKIGNFVNISKTVLTDLFRRM